MMVNSLRILGIRKLPAMRLSSLHSKIKLAELALRSACNAMKSKTSISHEQAMIKKLRTNPKFAVAYLKAALEDAEEPRVLLIVLRQIAKARGIEKVASKARIERESLYRALSPRGNPTLATLMAVTKALGLTLTVEPAA
jgi:probable addiction module antidote protein